MLLRTLLLICFCCCCCLLPPHAAHADDKTLAILGDSVTEGYGVAKEQAYPALVQKDLKGWKVQNLGVSGSTSATLKSRMAWLLKAKPKKDAVLIVMGGNDGLRGLSVKELKKNLNDAVSKAKAAGIFVLLSGYQAPPNLGAAYTSSFAAVYQEIAKAEKVPLYPFILDGVAGNPKLNQVDGIHPTAEGHVVIAGKVLAFLKKELP